MNEVIEVAEVDLRDRIIDALSDKPKIARDVCERLSDVPAGTVRRRLRELLRDGAIDQNSVGQYRLAVVEPPEPDLPDLPDRAEVVVLFATQRDAALSRELAATGKLKEAELARRDARKRLAALESHIAEMESIQSEQLAALKKAKDELPRSMSLEDASHYRVEVNRLQEAIKDVELVLSNERVVAANVANQLRLATEQCAAYRRQICWAKADLLRSTPEGQSALAWVIRYLAALNASAMQPTLDVSRLSAHTLVAEGSLGYPIPFNTVAYRRYIQSEFEARSDELKADLCAEIEELLK